MNIAVGFFLFDTIASAGSSCLYANTHSGLYLFTAVVTGICAMFQIALATK